MNINLKDVFRLGSNRFWHHFKFFKLLNLLIICASIGSYGCSQPQPVQIQAPLALASEHKPAIYINVHRDARLPAEFTQQFKQISEQALAAFNVTIDEGHINDAALAAADWVMTLRSTRIKPHYSYQHFHNSVLDGLSDCKMGTALGLGLLLAPCNFSGDEDFLEAIIRDARGNTLRTYQLKAGASGIMWMYLPVYLENLSETSRWQQQITDLYREIQHDGVFQNSSD